MVITGQVQPSGSQSSKRIKVEGQFSQDKPSHELEHTKQLQIENSELMQHTNLKDQMKSSVRQGGPQSTSLVETFTRDQIITYLTKLKQETLADNQKTKRKVCYIVVYILVFL